jgi:thiol-disulfide isomerase/thioredoxin
VQIDEAAPDFELPDLQGRSHRLAADRGRIVILNFWSCDCPHAIRTDTLLMRWQARWGEQVTLLPVASNANESLPAIAAAAALRKLPTILLDRSQVVADRYEAHTTPHAFVIDADGCLRYRGAVDDTSFSRRRPNRYFLMEAVEALLLGKSPEVQETTAYGCSIIRHALE